MATLLYHNNDLAIVIDREPLRFSGQRKTPRWIFVQVHSIKGMKPEITTYPVQPLNDSLIKKAMRARELGLDVEIPEPEWPKATMTLDQFRALVDEVYSSRTWSMKLRRFVYPKTGYEVDEFGRLQTIVKDSDKYYLASVSLPWNGSISNWGEADIQDVPESIVNLCNELTGIFAKYNEKVKQDELAMEAEKLARELKELGMANSVASTGGENVVENSGVDGS